VKEEKVLLIDDFRNFDGVTIARTYQEGIEALEAGGPWDLLMLDHDLGCYDFEKGREMTGYDVVCWLEEHPGKLPKRVQLVSANPSGVERMSRGLRNLYKKIDSLREFSDPVKTEDNC
jgi:CheY-like chemotaxis protein